MSKHSDSGSDHDTVRRHRVVIVGGGFGGLTVAQSLRRADVEITLIDRRNFHLFQPLLYQVATGGLSPANIAAPLRAVLSRQRNCRVILADVVGFDLSRNAVQLDHGETHYDSLVVAAGVRHSYFGNDAWESCAPGLKTIEDATEIRARVLSAFEAAEQENDVQLRRARLTFVIVGAGPTGVELAGALAEISDHSLKHDFRSINPPDARILLIEAGSRVLPAFPEDLSQQAERSLQRLGVEVRVNCRVTDLNPREVTIQSSDVVDRVATRTVLWAAGVQATPLAHLLADATGCPLDRVGRLMVQADFSVTGHSDLFVIGDMAHYRQLDGAPLPGVAPAAIQAGRYVARLITRRQQAKPIEPFKYRDRGSLATIGRSKAVAAIGRWHFSGFFAWGLWLFVHLMAIVSFRNRLLVLLQWAWSYCSYDRAARLITGQHSENRAGTDATAGNSPS